MKNSSKADLTLGIDIGGTNTVFGIVDDNGDILAKGNIPTTGHPGFTEYIDNLYEAVSIKLRDAGIPYERLAAIGVGAPCINTRTGVIEGAVDLPWESPIPLTDRLTAVFGLPAAGENDANAAALGEMYYGAARGMDNYIMLTLGTGVGSAIICDGRLLRGKRGLAGELGHAIIRHDQQARPCSCGRKGCLETYTSARGVVETAKRLISDTDTPSILRNFDEINAKDIGEAAKNGDPLALATFRITGDILGEACANFTTFSSPEAFIFFGGVAHSFPFFEEAMRRSFNRHLLWVYDGQVSFMRSSLPEADAAILGAAATGRAVAM
ncbi:MAG: ROK family protein [Muribaculaceae bacterium]|nr:ROK family protein [Muribaculaceae bacterium]